MATQTKEKKISLEEKVNLIYRYIFSNKKAEEEQNFRNKLNEKEISEIENIQKEKMTNFSDL